MRRSRQSVSFCWTMNELQGWVPWGKKYKIEASVAFKQWISSPLNLPRTFLSSFSQRTTSPCPSSQPRDENSALQLEESSKTWQPFLPLLQVPCFFSLLSPLAPLAQPICTKVCFGKRTFSLKGHFSLQILWEWNSFILKTLAFKPGLCGKDRGQRHMWLRKERKQEYAHSLHQVFYFFDLVVIVYSYSTLSPWNDLKWLTKIPISKLDESRDLVLFTP